MDADAPLKTAQHIYDSVNSKLSKLKDELDHTRVQLAGCLVAAEGNATGENDCEKGDYGWSAAFAAVKRLRAERDILAEKVEKTFSKISAGF